MPTKITERAMSSDERKLLQEIANCGLSRSKLLAFNVAIGIVCWGWGWGILILGWLVVAWLVRITMGEEIGWHSAAADWVIPLGGVAAALYMIGIAVFAFRDGQKGTDARLQADMEAGRVVEEDYEFTAALRMQEQEHGGLIYFLRTTGGKVLVLYDGESQQIGVQGEDPLSSNFRLKNRLTMVRASETGYVLEQTFSGEPLDAGEPLALTAPYKRWPEGEEFCDVPWENLEATYCR